MIFIEKNLNKILMFIILLTATFFATNSLNFNDNTVTGKSKKLRDSFNVFYIDDTENQLSLSQIYKLPVGMYADSNRKLHSPESLVFSVWYRINLKNDVSPLNSPFNVTVDNPTLDSITFYLLDKGNVVEKKRVGDTHRTASKLDHVVPQINLYNGIDHEQYLYIHVQTNGASASPISIELMEDSQLRNSAQLMLIGCFIGVILIMIIYNFIMFRGLGDPSYFNYIGYICFAGFTLSLINGFTFYVFPFEIARWLNAHLMITHFIGLSFALKFAISFLRFDKIKPWFVSVGVIASKVILVFALSGFIFTEATLTPFYFSAVLFVYIYAVGLMVMVVNARLMWVKYYLLSWIPLFVGVGIGIAAFNGGVPYNFLTRNAAMLGVLAEICIMAIALMDRFRANEVDKDYRINHDSITGLPNKMALTNVVERLVNNKKKFTLVLFEVPEANNLIPSLGIDLANQFFKDQFNNIENYAAGLTSVYQFERNVENETYHVARVGESCFSLIFVGDLPDDALSYNVLAIQEAVSTLVIVNGVSISVSCRAGVVSYPSDTNENENDNVLSMAFQALLSRHKSDRGWIRYDQQKAENIRKRFKLAAELQHAIDADDLELYHQPQLSNITDSVYGSELLLRWEHSELGFISPEVIISIAEETGIIHQLTEWIITQGFSQHAKLYRLGFEHAVSINISGKDLTGNGLIAHILTNVVEFGIPPESITFELTESATADDPVMAKRIITELHQQGFKIAIDDFGTGYSSLDYLSQLPFHELKIDKCFMDIDVSTRNRTITETTILLGKRLGVSVVAEGVETQAVADLLKSFSCPFVQGYLFAKPMPFIEYMRWLQQKNIDTV